MKRSHALRALTAAALALLLLALAPAALAEDPMDGVTWDMTVDDILALEGYPADDDVFIIGGGAYTQYGLLRLDGEYIRVAVYVFKGDQLVLYGYNASASMQRGKLAFADIYAELLAELTGEYGEPTADDPQPAVDAANVIEADSIKPEDIEAFAGWEPAGGVALYHLYVTGGDEESVVTVFVNEALLYAE